MLLDLSHSESRRLLATGAPAWLTINPVEYHGPHLSLHNDRLLAVSLARDLHGRFGVEAWPMLLAADLEVGVEPCPGPGSRHTPYPVVRDLVLDACRAVVELGARRVVLMTFHGAPLHNLALEDGVRWLTARGIPALAPLHYLMHDLIFREDWTALETAVALVPDAAARPGLRAGLRTDFHAGFFETSMALHYAPDSVSPSYASLPPCPPVTPDRRAVAAARLARAAGRPLLGRELDFAAQGLAWGALRPFPGYTSSPAHASAAVGAAFAQAMLDEYAPRILDVLQGGAQPPAPPMSWLRRATLHGHMAPRWAK